MEIAKLILTFIADIIHYLAWPAAVVTIVVLLADPIKAMFARIKQARVKKGDTELTLDMMEAIEAFGKEKPGVIPITDVTPDNLNWATYLDLARRFLWTSIVFVMNAEFDEGGSGPDVVRNSIHNIEKVSVLRKDDMTANESARVQVYLAAAREEFASILDNPS